MVFQKPLPSRKHYNSSPCWERPHPSEEKGSNQDRVVDINGKDGGKNVGGRTRPWLPSMKHKSRPQHPQNKSNQRLNVGPIIQDVLKKRKVFMFGLGRYGEWGYQMEAQKRWWSGSKTGIDFTWHQCNNLRHWRNSLTFQDLSPAWPRNGGQCRNQWRSLEWVRAPRAWSLWIESSVSLFSGVKPFRGMEMRPPISETKRAR